MTRLQNIFQKFIYVMYTAMFLRILHGVYRFMRKIRKDKACHCQKDIRWTSCYAICKELIEFLYFDFERYRSMRVKRIYQTNNKSYRSKKNLKIFCYTKIIEKSVNRKTISLVSRIVILSKSIIGKDLTLKSINLQSVTFKDTQGKVTKAAEKAQKKK